MAAYKLTIKNNGKDEIVLSTLKENSTDSTKSVLGILGISFKMNTLNDDTRNRSDAVRAEFKIKGRITSENRDDTKKITKWSMDSNQSTIYRNVELVVYEGEENGTILRRYQIDSMFVVDYEENFEDKGSDGTFELFIAQKERGGNKEVFSS